jgi:serine/threonine-protein kinase
MFRLVHDEKMSMSTAKKLPKKVETEADQLEFDVNDDWRKRNTTTHTDIFKEEGLLDSSEEELNTDGLSLDMEKVFAKESAGSHAIEQAKKSRLSKRNGKSETLVQLQAAVDGQSNNEEEEMEILTEKDKELANDPIFSNRGDLYPQIHGNYFLLDHMVDGGMAKVCRARYLGEGDEADKMVAIKMVQEKFSSDDDFVQMFIDEIKVSFGLNHPNINTTFDYGKIGKNLFVSMEYIHGKDLMDLVDDLRAAGKTIPVPMAIYITSKMCEALHYAHNFTNQLTGQKYNIVHRDISPHNVMISYEGYVKVIDFGIAKADTNSTEEAEGTIKGKINYFAPEYLEGEKIDHRYDQFAVALTLWEMLTGDKAFKGSGQIETLKTILACKPAMASAHNSEVTPALDALIMKALSRDPAYRYKDMLGFNKELMKLLYQDYPDFHESDIADLMKDLFKESYESDLAKFKGFGKFSISDIVAKIKAYKEFQKRQSEKTANKKGRDSEVTFDFGFEEESVSAKSKKGIDNLVRKRKSKKEKQKETFSLGENKRQKALASLLLESRDNDEKEEKAPIGFPWIKIGFLGLLVLGFSKREVLLSLLKPDEKQAEVAREKEPIVDSKPLERVELTTEQLKAQMQALIEKRKRQAQKRVQLELVREKAIEKSVNVNTNKDQATPALKEASPKLDQDDTNIEVKKVTVKESTGATVTSPISVEERVELSEEDKRDLSTAEKELADLREKMNALIEKNKASIADSALDSDKDQVKGSDFNIQTDNEEDDLKTAQEVKEEEQKRLKALMTSKLDELDKESATTPKPSEGLSGKFIEFMKTRKGLSWIFD